MKLLTSQKNYLYRLIEQTQMFNPSQFEIIEYPFNTRIKYKNSDFYFDLKRSSDSSTCSVSFSPAYDIIKDGQNCQYWSDIERAFNEWLLYISREILEPNLWERLPENIQLANARATQNYLQFTVSEYQDLKQKMSLLGTQMKALPFLVESHTEIQTKLDHITQLAETMSKFDWTNLLVGTMMGVVMQLSLTPENATALWNLIKSLLKGYFLN